MTAPASSTPIPWDRVCGQLRAGLPLSSACAAVGVPFWRVLREASEVEWAQVREAANAGLDVKLERLAAEAQARREEKA